MDKSGFALDGLWQSLRASWQRRCEAAMMASMDPHLRADIGGEAGLAPRALVSPLVFCWVR